MKFISELKNRRVALYFKLFFSISLLSILIIRIDIQQLMNSFGMLSVAPVIAGLVIYAFAFFLQAWRMAAIADLIAVLPFRSALAITWVGNALSQMLPSQVGGDPFRIWYLSRHDIGLRAGFMVVLADRVVGFVALVLVLAVGLFRLPAMTEAALLQQFIIVVVAVGLGGWFVAGLFDRILAALLPVRYQEAYLVRLAMETAAFLRRATITSWAAIIGVSMSVLAQIAQTAMAWLLAGALGLNIDFLSLLLFMPLVGLATFLPVSIAGWGLREVVLVSALGTVGITSEASLALSLLIGMVQLVAALPGLVVWVLLKR